jgi:hypothetical protein
MGATFGKEIRAKLGKRMRGRLDMGAMLSKIIAKLGKSTGAVM